MTPLKDIVLVVPIREGYSGITLDLGLLYLYSALKEHGLDATILHCPKEKIDLDTFKKILIGNPHIKVIGFKAYSVDHNSVKEMSVAAKEILPECVTIAGGPHPTSLAEYMLKDISSLDYVFSGEGEIGFPLFCKNILSGRQVYNIPGVAYRMNGSAVRNKQQVIMDLNMLPRVRWEEIGISEYPDFLTSLPFIPIMATRGCPYHCKYCAAHKVAGRKLRFRSVEDVVEELKLLKKIHGIRAVNFSDDELTLNRKYFVELCNRLIDSRLGIEWECSNGVRLDTVSPEILDLMYEAGCRYISIGIESASDEILTRMEKNITTDIIREKVATVKKSKIIPQGLFMIGFPGEKEADIEKTIDFAVELDIDKTNFSIFMPLPGSEIFEELIYDGEIVLDKIDWNKMRPDAVVYRNPNISHDRLKFLQKRAYAKFYLRIGPMKRLLKEFLFKRGGIKALTSKIRSVFFGIE